MRARVRFFARPVVGQRADAQPVLAQAADRAQHLRPLAARLRDVLHEPLAVDAYAVRTTVGSNGAHQASSVSSPRSNRDHAPMSPEATTARLMALAGRPWSRS